VESGTDTEPMSTGNWAASPFSNLHDFFNFGSTFKSNKRQYYTANVDLHTTLSFKEAVQGCKKELSYSRQVKCPHCQGSGNKPANNGCKKCGGKGQVTARQGNSVFIQTCSDCHGKNQTKPCTDCKNSGTLETDASVHVSIPAFVVDGNILRLQGMGHFAGTILGGLQDQYTDAHLHIKVIPEIGLHVEGRDIVSELHVSLLDALRGCTRQVKTIDGNKEININKGARNRDEVVLLVGDDNNIKHRVIVNVEYPANFDKLIDVLSEGE
jgi:molecular chaperone DnaJ